MRKRTILGSLVMTAILAVSGCGTEEVPQNDAAILESDIIAEDTAQVYGTVLDSVYHLIANGYADGTGFAGVTGIEEAAFAMEPTEALDSIGYLVQDISGDGIPELLIGYISEKDGGVGYGTDVLAVYTNTDGQPVCTLEGWSRNSYKWLGNGEFFNQGSNGAVYSIFGTYQISEDGTALDCTAFYFTYEKDESFEEIGLYYNTTGEWDVAASEEFTQSADEFWAIEMDLMDQAQMLTWTPFSAYSPTQEAASSAGNEVRADYAENILQDFSEWDAVTLEGDEGQVEIAFVGEDGVSDFRIYSLLLEDTDENGAPIFTTTEVYRTEQLNSEYPLVVGMTFQGDIPSYGISYTNAQGETKFYAVQISGMDGSIQLVTL